MSSDMTRIVGRNICIGRKYRELSQEKLAEQCHCDRSTISRFENGRKSPTIEHLEIIASALDVDIITLLSKDQLLSDTPSLEKISKDLESLSADYSYMADRIRIMEESDRHNTALLERMLEFFNHLF